ncbi:MAG: HAMP domain-containing protein [Gammaproteobacteria bacterium]|nr:HAMP domain-containing protein [Gammaproteobacteria bacterium]
MTIRRTLLFALLGFGVLAAVLTSLLAYTRARAALSDEIRLHLVTQAQTLSQQVGAALFERLQDIQGWQRLEVMQEVRVGDVDKRLARYLADVAATYAGVYVDLLCVADGRIVAASDPGRIGAPYAAPTPWREVDYRGTRVTLARPVRDGPHVTLDFALALHDDFAATPAPIGFLHARYDWAEIEAALDQSATGGRDALLLDADGSVLAASATLRAHGADATYSLPVPRAARVAEIDGGALGLERVLVGQAPVAAYRALPDLGWSIAVLTPVDVAFAPVRALLWQLVAALGFICAVAALLAIALSMRTAGPIVALTRYTRELARDLDAPTRRIEGSREIVELCAAFNRLIDELKRSRVHLVRASKLAAIGEMAARLAHEVRTPLGIIRSSAQLMNRQSGLDTTGHEMMSFMISECDRMNALVTGLLESAKPRTPQFTAQDVDDIVRHVVDPLRERAAARRVVIESATAGGGAPVECDRDQIVQVLLNLVVNALQAVADGGHVRLTTASNGSDLRIDVDDDGPGIAPARREEILEPFVSDRAGGIGLGLSIVREIVALHRGRLVIADSPLGGARFTLWLPRERGAAESRQQ